MPASRRRRALLGAAAAVPVVLAIQPPPVAAEPTTPDRREADPPDPQDPFCSTVLLTAEELDRGAISDVRCFATMDESLRAIGVDLPAAEVERAIDSGASLNASGVVAIHHQFAGGGGEALAIGGGVCRGGGVTFAAGDWWNDRITSTTSVACSSIKHWTDADFTGETETVSGGYPSNLRFAGYVSSMRYY